MKIYLAGEVKVQEFEEYARRGAMKRRLMSYFYHQTLDEDVRRTSEAGMDMFLDSGAYTAFTKKVTIESKTYARYIHDSKGIWTVSSSLDAIGRGEEAARQSYENLKALEAEGVKVAPVFHVREPDHWLKRYMDEGYDYIFIGGMVAESKQWLEPRLDGLFGEILCDAHTGLPRVKLHGFGLTSERLMMRYPWYSVDSSSWLMASIYGAVFFLTPEGLKKYLFTDESPDLRKAKGKHYKNLAPAQQEQILEWLHSYGIDDIGLEQISTYYRYRNIVNAMTFTKLDEADLGAKNFMHRQPLLFA